MHFSQAVASIQSLVGVIRGVHIVYREEQNFEHRLYFFEGGGAS